MPLNAAGTRPEPAVSVPTPKSAIPSATATAEPELDPPATRSGTHALRTTPYGERVPTRPVANWSRFVLPSTIAPGRDEPLDGGRRAARARRRSPGSPRRRQAGDVDVVLDRDDRAREREPLAARDGRVDALARRQRLGLGPERDPDVRAVDLLDQRVRGGDAARRTPPR